MTHFKNPFLVHNHPLTKDDLNFLLAAEELPHLRLSLVLTQQLMFSGADLFPNLTNMLIQLQHHSTRDRLFNQLLTNIILPNPLLFMICKISPHLFPYHIKMPIPTEAEFWQANYTVYDAFRKVRQQYGLYSFPNVPKYAVKQSRLGAQWIIDEAIDGAYLFDRLTMLRSVGCTLVDPNHLLNTLLHQIFYLELGSDILENFCEYNRQLPENEKINLNIPNTAFNSCIADLKTPLHLAILMLRRMDDIVLLLKMGANPNAQDIYGLSPLHYAVILANFDLIFCLKKYGGSFRVKDHYGHSPLDFFDDRCLLDIMPNCCTADEVIRRFGLYTNINYDLRSVGSRKNFLAGEPTRPPRGLFFFFPPSFSCRGNVYPSLRSHYMDKFGNTNSNYDKLYEIAKTSKQGPKMMDEFFEVSDYETFLEHIVTRRSHLQKIFKDSLYNLDKSFERLRSHVNFLHQVDKNSMECDVNDRTTQYRFWIWDLFFKIKREHGLFYLHIHVPSQPLKRYLKEVPLFFDVLSGGGSVFLTTPITLSALLYICGEATYYQTKFQSLNAAKNKLFKPIPLRVPPIDFDKNDNNCVNYNRVGASPAYTASVSGGSQKINELLPAK